MSDIHKGSAVPLGALVVVPLGSTMSKITVKQQKNIAEFTGRLTQVLAEMKLVKASTGEWEEIKREQTLIQQIYRYGMKRSLL